MKRTLIALLTVALLVAIGPALAQESSDPPPKPEPKPAPPSSVHGYVSFGGLGNGNTDYMGRISEFSPSRQGGRGAGGAAVWGNAGRVYFDFQGGIAGNSQDQDYRLNVDAHRYWRTEFKYTRLPHRLDHDPLSTLDAAKGAIVVRHDDMNPNELYEIARGELQINSKFVMPRLRGVTFHFGFRDERRDGTTQARTLSKCANCHAVAQTRGVDQVTQDFTAGVQLATSHVMFEYSYLNRSFREGAPTPTNVYDFVMHPATTARVFDNRIQYQLADGPLPFNHIPDVRKESHSFRARVNLPKDVGLNLNYVQAIAENEETGLGVDSNCGRPGWACRWASDCSSRPDSGRCRFRATTSSSMWWNRPPSPVRKWVSLTGRSTTLTGRLTGCANRRSRAARRRPTSSYPIGPLSEPRCAPVTCSSR